MATRTRKTGPKAASAAAKVLADSRSTKREKSAAASALAQVEGGGAARAPSFTTGDYAAEDIVRFFRYAHLGAPLQAHARPFHDLAVQLMRTLPRCPERTVALRKLLEAKDAAVRAALPPV
jgi:hypothetical protein